MFEFLGKGKKGEEKMGSTPKPTISIVPGTGATIQAGGGQLLTSEGREVTAVVEDLEKEVERIKDSMNVMKESIKGVNSKLEEIEKTLGQLASIYEVVMNQLNPFLDEDERALPVRGPRVVKEEGAKEERQRQAEMPIERRPTQYPEEPQSVVLPSVDITNPKVIEVLIDWVKFMVEKVGHTGIDELLQYYVDIRWISEDVKEVLKRYADGIRVDIEPDIVSVQLDPEDHAKSLEYILSIKELMSR